MIRLRTKLWMFFLCMILLLYGVAYVLYNSSQQSVEEYNHQFNRFLLLNDVSQQTDQVLQRLNTYLGEKSPENQSSYQANRENLRQLQKRLVPEIEHQDNHIRLKSYSHMIGNFLKEADLAFNYSNLNDDAQSSYHYEQAVQLSRFILQTTQDLIDRELTQYYPFYADMVERNRHLQSMSTAIFISILLTAGLFTYGFAGGITRPIEQLAREAKQISRGNLDGDDIRVKSRDEIFYLAESFNRMRQRLKELIQEIKEKASLEKALQQQRVQNLEVQNLLKEMELKTLQNQIQPHFLFNTLNVISKQAYLEGAEQASGLIESVARMFRYNLKGMDRPVTLKEETGHVQHYFAIQTARFRERVGLSIEVEESCLPHMIPVLTLQPLVENAFIHGVEDCEAGAVIRVRVYRDESDVVVEVEDNGKGMDADTVRRLLHPESEGGTQTSGHSTGLGVQNVLKRLRLFYGREEIVQIESEPGKGTQIRLSLPYTVASEGGG
ncbi:sensor histidine kinase [Desmospora profundinema]|uniref:histidine kinase n=1 Tax=Desmospora profundinema TaxID=1571184 RepID=A0ABU1IPY3_9BACL|nr:histidine kinase [Desmospora profundinema]MDR6226862.1 sensor histidine kinase YesM [Desmospora profundinema]